MQIKKYFKPAATGILVLSFLLSFWPPMVMAAAPDLGTILPSSFNSQSGTTWTTTTAGNVDEGIAGADGQFIVAGTNSTSSIFYDMANTPSDFVKMSTLNYNIRYQITPLSNDTETLFIQVFKSDLTTALTNEMTVVSTTTPITLTNKGVTSFTGVDTTATKADWDGAVVRIRTTHTKSAANDNSIWSIDAFELTGTYNSSPTVSLSSPADTATGQSSTPTLNFTGTDADGEDVAYEVQIDTANTFDSQSGSPFIDASSLTGGHDAAQFTGAPDNTNPYASGQQVSFTVPSGETLSTGTTYFWRIRASDPSGTNAFGAWSSTFSFTTLAGALDHYNINITTPQTAGICSTGTNTVTAKDSGNGTVSTDTSTIDMTNSGMGITFYTASDCLTPTTQYTLSSGVANIYYKTNKAQSFTVTATKDLSVETGTSGSITVNPSTQTRLVVTLPGEIFTAGGGNSGSVTSQTANSQFTLTSLTATDNYFNIVTGYSGTKALVYSGPSSSGGTPNYTTSVSFTNGQSTTTLLTTLTTAETTTITVTDGGQYGFASSPLTVQLPVSNVHPVNINPGTTINGGINIKRQ